jgi:hypothetical protein
MAPSIPGHRPFRRARPSGVAAMAFAVVAVVAAACGGATPSGSKAPTSPSASTTSTAVQGFVTPEVKFGTGQEGAPDPTTSVPTDTGTKPINPLNDAGQEVIIAKGGYLLPQWLVAEVTLPITWTNLSGDSQQVVFNDAPVHSDIIPPGGTFTWKSPGFAISLMYHTANGHTAKITLQSPDAAS